MTQVRLTVKEGADVSAIEMEYGEMSGPYPRHDEDNLVDYYLGDEDEDDDGIEWLKYDDAVAFCGFCDGAIPDSIPWIVENGDWAQGLIGCRDFSRYAMSEEEKVERLRVSGIYWDARRRGESAVKLLRETVAEDVEQQFKRSVEASDNMLAAVLAASKAGVE